MKLRRILATLLAICLIVSLLPVGALAATSGTTGSCTWTLNGTELTISGSGAMGSHSYNSLPWGKNITKVTIKSGVTEIGDFAFYGCSKLTSVSIPSTVTEIGNYSFYMCSALSSVSIPSSVTRIGNQAFFMAGLKSISIPNSVTYLGSECFMDCDDATSLSIGSGVTSITGGMFLGCSSLSSISVSSSNANYMSKGNCIISKKYGDLILGCKNSTIPTDGSVTEIENGAFRGMTGLTSISIPASVTKIGPRVFQDSGLTSITLNSGLTSIGEYAFLNCGIQSITLPDTLKSIGERAFAGTNLRSIVLPDSVTSLGAYAFSGCSYLSSITIGSGVTKIEPGMFSGCPRQTLKVSENNSKYYSVSDSSIIETASNTLILGNKYAMIPDGVVTIGTSAFEECGAQTVVIPDSVTTIGERAFLRCPLTSLTIGSGVTEIGKSAFLNCSTLSKLVIPGNVKTIAYSAFSTCSSLTDLELQEGITTIGQDAFRSCSKLADISLPDSVTSIYNTAFMETAHYKDTANWDGSVYYIGKHLMDVSSPTGIYQIREGTTVIANYAFYGETGLTQVVMPDSVTHIGEYAFYNCTGLTEFPIGEGLISIGYYAFGSCKTPTELTLPDSLTTIGGNAFYGCNGIVTLTLGKSLETIGYWAFYNTSSLERVEISSENPYYTSKDGILYTKDMSTVVLQPAAHKLYLAIRYLDGTGNAIEVPQTYKYASGATYSVTSPEIPGYYTDTPVVSGTMTGDKTVDVVYYVKTAVVGGVYGSIRWTLFDDGMLVLKGKGAMPEEAAPWSAYADQIKTLYIDSRITTISADAFRDLTALTYADLGYGITSIGSNAFAGCTGLQSIRLPNTVTAIGDSAFAGCTGLTAATLPDSLKTLGAQAFADCTGLEKITMGASVETIGADALAGCTALTQVYFRGAPATLGTNGLGTTGGKYVYYYTTVAGWEEAVVDGLWLGYTAIPYQAIAGEDFTGTNVYILKVVDRHNTPIEDAWVYVGRQLQATNEDGMAYFVRPTEPVKLTVSAGGYIHFEDQEYSPRQGQHMDYVELTRQPSVLMGISCNGQSIATGVYTLNCNSDANVKVTVQGFSTYDIVKYELVQGNRLIAELRTAEMYGVFNVSADSFEEGETVIAKMYCSDGSVVSTALNIQPLWIADVSQVQILDELSQLKLHLELGSLGSYDLPLSFKSANGHEVYTAVEGNTIRIGLNVDINQIFAKEKDEVTAKTRIQKEIQEKMRTFAEGKSGFQYNMAGYLEIEYLGQGEYYVKTSYVKISVAAGLEFSAQASYFGIVGVYFKASLTGTGSLDIHVTRYSPEEGFQMDDANLGIENTLELVGGAYLLWGAGSAELYGDLSMGFQLGLVPDVEFESVYVTGALGVRWSAFWGLFSGSKQIVGGDIYRWPEVYAYARRALWAAETAPYAFNDRSYLENRSDWLSGDILQTGISDIVAPQVVTCGDTTVMVWLDDNESRDSSNYQTLYYAVYDPVSGSWSAPAQVDSNETFDCEFQLYTDDQQIYVLYTEQKQVLTGLESMDPTNPEDIRQLICGVEVAFATFENGSFTTPVRLTDNDLCETLPRLTGQDGDLVALWSVTEAMNAGAQAENNHLCASIRSDGVWSESAVCIGNQNSVSHIAFAGEAYFAYLVDADNDTQTTEDKVLIISDMSGNARQIAQGSITGVTGGQSLLVWNNGGSLYMLSEPTGTPAVLPDIQADGAFRITAISEEETLLTYTAGQKLYGAVIDEFGCAHPPVVLTEGENPIRGYDIGVAAEELVIVFTETAATISGDLVETQTRLRSIRYAFDENVVLEDAQFDITAVAAGQPLELILTLQNAGLTAAEQISVTLYDPDGTPVATGEVPVALQPGQRQTVAVQLQLPEQIQGGTYYLELADSRLELALGFSDLSVSAYQTVIGGRNYLSIQVANQGNIASDALIQVYAPGQTDSPIGQLSTGSLTPGQTQHYFMDVDSFVEDTQKLVTCQVTANEYDPFGVNDSCAVTLFRMNTEGFQQDPEQISVTPTLSTYYGVYDWYPRYDVRFTITAGVAAFTGLSGGATYTQSGGEITLDRTWLKSLSLGRHTVDVIFQNGIVRTFTIDVIDTTPIALSGTVQILGTVQTGTTVYADISALQPENPGVCYQWTLDGESVSTEMYYQIGQSDHGKTLTLTVSGTNGYTGTFTASKVVEQKKVAPPLTPVVLQVTCNSVTLAGTQGVEYSWDGITWQESAIFEGLSVNTTYTFRARYQQTADAAASDSGPGVTVTTPKYQPDAPAAPVVQTVTDVSVTLQAAEGCLYSLDGISWQESNVFANLQANTTYTFYQKLAENNEYYESPVSNGVTATTLKHTAQKPAAPTVLSRSSTTVMLDYVEGCEYSLDGINWQSLSDNLWHGPCGFTGLSPNTTYTFYQRVAETEDTYASPISDPLVIRTWKMSIAGPAAPTVAEVTAQRITLEANSGYEYKIERHTGGIIEVTKPAMGSIWGTAEEPIPDNTGWQSDCTFTDLAPNTVYRVYQRYAETDTAYASDASKYLLVTTPKAEAPTPTAPQVQEIFWDSIVLVHEEGYLYRLDDGAWQESNVFTGLLPNRSYTLYRKSVETDTTLESGSSAGTVVTTLKQTQETPEPPALVSSTHDSLTLEYNDLYEYRLEGGLWQTSPVFTGLQPATAYTVYRRLRATSEAYASADSQPLTVTTLKMEVAAPAAPSVLARGPENVTLSPVSGCEYRLEDGAWQSSPVFTGLTAGTTYRFYRRYAETATAYASPASEPLEVVTLKYNAPVPTAPQVEQVFSRTIYLVEEEGYLYRLDDGAWQESGIFTNLQPNHTYTFYRKSAETDTTLESASSAGTTVTTPKETVSCNTWPRLESRTYNSITLVYDERCEYRIEGGQWQDSPIFTGLLTASGYVFYCRYRETDTAFASESSQGIMYCTAERIYLAGQISVSGTPGYQQTLTATYSGEESLFTYQWYADGTPIEGATGSSYTVTKQDVGKTIKLVITGIDMYTGTVGWTAAIPAYLPGDVTGDGKVNMRDWNKLYEHVTEVSVLSEDALIRSDVNGDGRVNMKDWIRLYEHINEINPLW